MKHGIGAVGMALLCCVTWGWTSSTARAGACGSFSADGGDNTIILGEKAGYFWYQGQLWFYGLGELAICWQDTNGSNQEEFFPGCDTSSSSSDYIYVTALSGDDVVWPNTVAHYCQVSPSSYVLPFDDVIFDFYLDAEMGTGSDTAYGTEHGDVLLSNKWGGFGVLPADSAPDRLCGYGGNDTLYGDHDDSDAYEESISGGSGTDYCNGGYDGDYYDWLDSGTCETMLYGWHANSRLGCDDSRSQHNSWWF